MPGSQENQQQAVNEWLLQMYDAGTALSVIQRMSAWSNQQTRQKLQNALDCETPPAEETRRD